VPCELMATDFTRRVQLYFSQWKWMAHPESGRANFPLRGLLSQTEGVRSSFATKARKSKEETGNQVLKATDAA